MPAMLHYHRQSLNPDRTIIVFFWCGLIGRWTLVLPLCLATHSAEYLQSLSAPPATDGLVMLPLVLWSRPTTTNPTNSCLKISATNYETARLLSTRLCSFSARVRKSEMKGLFCCKKWRVGKVKFGGTEYLCHDVCKGSTFKYIFSVFQKRREGPVIILNWTNFKYHYIIEFGVLDTKTDNFVSFSRRPMTSFESVEI